MYEFFLEAVIGILAGIGMGFILKFIVDEIFFNNHDGWGK